MTESFRLVPFDSATAPARVRLEGDLSRTDERLRLRYRLADPGGTLRIPPAAPAPRRRDELWSRTCLELFLAVPGSVAYWEVNLSPSGDWNVYRLSGYRQGLAPEPAVTALPFAVERCGDGLELKLEFHLAPLVATGQPLQMAVTAVLEHHTPPGVSGEGPLSYWALGHPGPVADFHDRDGFLLRI
ncbi:DOMON-like domain-containing protein [Vulcanococcus limneticus]|uniref:DOMON-like domain-containing protein n=1 Tax=Vulcanococcus limneticus TaxID=2170428 RepID=UPI00398BF774